MLDPGTRIRFQETGVGVRSALILISTCMLIFFGCRNGWTPALSLAANKDGIARLVFLTG